MPEQIANKKSFGGWQKRYRHFSSSLNCEMCFSIYLPPQAEHGKVPVLYWLSGLTCDDENFLTKAGAQRYAADCGIAIVTPDTSPRGTAVPDDEAWDFAQGAGFYVNATEHPWAANYQMYNYIVDELPGLINASQPVDPDRCGIFGHSMGGHGALTIALKNPGIYKSVSAFSPICAPMHCPWGEKALSSYLGKNRESWKNYDSCELVSVAAISSPILIDQGMDDEYLYDQLKPEMFLEASKKSGQVVELRMQPGYDHSYFFISSFIEDHIHHHRQILNGVKVNS